VQQPTDLDAFVESYLRSLSKQTSKDLNLSVKMPRAVEGFSNRYIIATIMPLLENAVEAMPSGSKIDVSLHENDDEVSVEVANYTIDSVNETALRTVGTTTKGATHKGLGLSIVRELAGIVDGTVSARVDDDRVIIDLRLPRRAAAR
jgi:sensor histidine kinase regulating citrate/malate metabolism